MSARQKALRQGEQCDMFAMFAAGETAKRTGELPDTLEAGVVAYRGVIDRYNAALLADDAAAVKLADEDAHAIAAALNGGTTLGICGGPDRPGCQLEALTAAPVGTVPIHGQAGEFTLDLDGYSIRVNVDGLMGLQGFEIHSIDGKACPISNTGYRSFCGSRYSGCGGLAVEPFVRAVIAAHMKPPPKKVKRKKGDPPPEMEWEDDFTD